VLKVKTEPFLEVGVLRNSCTLANVGFHISGSGNLGSCGTKPEYEKTEAEKQRAAIV